jgi:hypothetical protein
MTRRRIARFQAVYYVATGVWPIASMRTFEAVTGPKTEDWLVRTVGLLAATIGLVLGGRTIRVTTSARRDGEPDVALGVGSALAFATTDVAHVVRREISPIYLADAALELALVAGWLLARPAGQDAEGPGQTR